MELPVTWLESAPARLAWTLLVSVIGPAVAQSQTPTALNDWLAVPSRDRRLSEEFSERFSPGRPQDWQRGFALALDLGQVALPLLADLADREDADLRRRLLLLGAASIAGGPAADPILLAPFGRRRPGNDGVRERVLAGLVLALAPERGRPGQALAAVMARGRLEPIERVAVALAAARFADVAELPAAWYRSADPAVVAAASFARPPEGAGRLATWMERDLPHAALVRRGALLGAPPERFDAAAAGALVRHLAGRSEGAAQVRLAAALHLARVAEPAEWLDLGRLPVDAELVPLLAAEPAFRQELMRRGLLGAPPARLLPELRARTAVAFALAADREALVGTADAWRRDDVAGRALCLALAWRWFREPASAVEEWIEWLPAVREVEWVRLSCGLPAAILDRSLEDETLDRAFVVAVASGDRLEPAAAAAAIEDALWRSGAHPAASRIDAELDFIRDLLLAGSTHGAAVLGLGTDPRLRHLPDGLSAGDDVFEIGYELYRFFRGPARPRPAAARLR